MKNNKREKIRMSADKNDKSYRADHYKFEAYLDGEVQPYCVTADEIEGTVECVMVDPDSGKILTHPRTGEILKETKTGVVEIRKNPHVD